MNKLFFTTVEINGFTDDNRTFYLSEEEARKETEAKIHEEIRNVQKLINDYKLDMPILTNILKDVATHVYVREYALCEGKAS